MKITGRVLQVSIIVIGVLFILLGIALSELDILSNVNEFRSNNLDSWKEFLSPWIQGVPEPEP